MTDSDVVSEIDHDFYGSQRQSLNGNLNTKTVRVYILKHRSCLPGMREHPRRTLIRSVQNSLNKIHSSSEGREADDRRSRGFWEFVSSGIESIQRECTSILLDIVQTSDVTVERRNVGEVE
jgi:hypothetical protein